MLDPFVVCPLSDFQQNTPEHIARLRENGKPAFLTVDGKAEIVVQDAVAYQTLLDALDRAETIIAIRKALDSIERGEKGIPVEEFFDSLREETKVRDPE